MSGSDSTFISCDCHGEMLEVTRYPEDSETYLSFWYYGGHDGKLRWQDRLKLVWKVLRSGRGHPDHLVLNPAQVNELRASLGASSAPPRVYGVPRITFSTGTTATNAPLASS